MKKRAPACEVPQARRAKGADQTRLLEPDRHARRSARLLAGDRPIRVARQTDVVKIIIGEERAAMANEPMEFCCIATENYMTCSNKAQFVFQMRPG